MTPNFRSALGGRAALYLHIGRCWPGASEFNRRAFTAESNAEET
jgi:hypothetical protein